jgi:thiol-disulfide isomerase/thioredoxin
MTNKIFIILLFSFLGLSSLAQRNKKLKQIPDYYVLTNENDSVNVKELVKGKVAFINFWFIPCAPCFMEMETLSQVYDKYRNDTNFVFISISKSSQASVARLLENNNADTSMHQFLTRYAGLDTLSFPIYYTISCADEVSGFGPYYRFSSPSQATACPHQVFGFGGYPDNIIVDKKGKVLYNQSGIAYDPRRPDYMVKHYTALIDQALK